MSEIIEKETTAPIITFSRLREMLSYDPQIGEFRWKISPNGRMKAGAIAGKTSKGYRQIGVDGRLYAAHRLAWLYQTGKWPVDLIDHINCDPGDNRFCNLREASRSENARNSKLNARNTSGFKGVTWEKNAKRWMAQIQVNCKNNNLGLFDTPEEAHSAYIAAAEKLHGEFARTR